ncbi:MAG: multicopper oxidase domain-containing protein, partial [Candidatus Kapabacteria bacterium]|nr:multicopper oxidase domain-containing protein [Candidatus Kapabacteria bacterium]
LEVLVDLSQDKGKDIFLKAFNAVLQQNVPGGDRFPGGPFANALARVDFNIMHIVVGERTANPVTEIPTQLVTVTPHEPTLATVTRKLTISDTMIPGNMGVSFVLNHRLYNEKFIDYNVSLGATEIWEIANSGNFAHPFHIHDVEFNILTRNGAVPPVQEQGWKDVVLVKSKETVRFIAKFDDFADPVHPFMFHCHIALHEDEGMMGQFVVVQPTSVDLDKESASSTIFPNPAFDHITVVSEGAVKEWVVLDMVGNEVRRGTGDATDRSIIGLSGLSAGSYLLRCVSTDARVPARLVRFAVTR